MKKSTLMLSVLAAATMFSCTKAENPTDGPVNPELNGAYVSLTISAPTSRVTDGGTIAGTSDENEVTDVALLAFDSKYNFIANYTNGELTTSSTGKPLYKCSVAPDVTRFLVIVNYKANAKLESAISKMAGAGVAGNDLYEAIVFSEQEIADMTKAGKFVMINAGAFVGGQDVPLVSLPDGEKLSQVEANPTELSIAVDRIVARFDYTVASPLAVPAAGDFAEIVGVKLNATNTKEFAYSKINTNSLLNGADYRFDPNMQLDSTNSYKVVDGNEVYELNWLKNNRDENSFLPSTEKEYVLENTCNPSHHDYNNLTQAVVKAYFTPSGIGLSDKESWFSVEVEGRGDIEMNFATIVDFYNGTLDVTKYGVVDAAIKAKMDKQLNHIMSFSPDATLAADGTAGNLTWATVTLAQLDAVPFGGYRAATAPRYFISYYQNSLNYYDIFIQHDDTQAIGHLGRWGMVRNNAYTMNIKSILGPGLPYIPSPFDKDILDPKNPKPEDPEPADKLDGFIDAEIVVNDWTTWTQDTDLQ